MNNDTTILIQTIIEGIQEKKGRQIVVIDLSTIDGAVCEGFVICEGSSPLQVEAITRSVIDTVHCTAKEKPLHVIGTENAQWVAIDFGNVIAHIFVPELRSYYAIEHLWEDANLTRIPDQD